MKREAEEKRREAQEARAEELRRQEEERRRQEDERRRVGFSFFLYLNVCNKKHQKQERNLV